MTWVFDCDLSDGVGWNQHGGAQTGTDQTIETFVFCITDSINMGWSAGWARDTALFFYYCTAHWGHMAGCLEGGLGREDSLGLFLSYLTYVHVAE